MSTIDEVAVAIDWLEAYRAASPSIVDLYADVASLECDCNGELLVAGRDAIATYWRQRFVSKPAGELEDVERDARGDVHLRYRVGDGIVSAILAFNEDGKISCSRCGPTSERDHYSWELECPKCKRIGAARVSECGGAFNLDFTVDDVSDGFRVSKVGACAVDTVIVCVHCNVPA